MSTEKKVNPFNFNLTEMLEKFIVDGLYNAKLVSIEEVEGTDNVRFTFVLEETGETMYIDRSNTLKVGPNFKGKGIHEVKSFVAKLANAIGTTDTTQWPETTVSLEVVNGFIRGVKKYEEQSNQTGVLL